MKHVCMCVYVLDNRLQSGCMQHSSLSSSFVRRYERSMCDVTSQVTLANWTRAFSRIRCVRYAD